MKRILEHLRTAFCELNERHENTSAVSSVHIPLRREDPCLPHRPLCAVIALAAGLALPNLTGAAESLKIKPACALPDYTKLGLVTNTSSAFPATYGTCGLGDFNEDGRLDVAILVGVGNPVVWPLGVGVHLQTASGTFTNKTDYTLPNTGVTWDFIVADFDEDGHLDLILDDLGNDLVMLVGNGDGTFQEPHHLGLSAPGFPVAVDLNADGHLDLVAGTLDGSVGVFAGAGDGTFTREATLNSTINVSHKFVRLGQIMVGDLNRDGELDVAIASPIDANRVGNLDVFLGNGDGTFEDRIQTPNVGTWRGALGDFNGDGILDFAGDRRSPVQLEIWIGQGDGRFIQGEIYPMTGSDPDVVQVGDLNSDGIMDVIVSNSPEGPLSFFLGKGDGTFQSRRMFTPLAGAVAVNVGPRLIDFNRDGLPDLITLAEFPGRPDPLALALNQGVKPDPGVGFLVNVQNSVPSASGAVVLEASANLVDWTPLATNTAAVASWSVVDANASGQPRLYYRTRRQ